MGMPGSHVCGNVEVSVNRKERSADSAILKIRSLTAALKIKAVYFFNVGIILCQNFPCQSARFCVCLFCFSTGTEIGKIFLSKVKSSDPFH